MTTAVGYLDMPTAAYVEDVVGAIAAHVPVVEAYVVGSGARGGFDPETSDVDVVVVIERRLRSDRRRVVDAIRALQCPVRDLELVIYVDGAQPPRFELNLNHGEETDAEPFWFVLDAALAQEHAVPLLGGRPWTHVFPRIDEEQIQAAVRESLEWAEARDDEFARVTATRSRHYLEHGEWISKLETAE
ncbi:MAG: nucleotidyltransferase domain-containing protein [Gaiellaceae bacterium]